MDLTISINGTKFETTLYEKPMALHLYIPPNSAHPLGVKTGEVLRINRLCSDGSDIRNDPSKQAAMANGPTSP